MKKPLIVLGSLMVFLSLVILIEGTLPSYIVTRVDYLQVAFFLSILSIDSLVWTIKYFKLQERLGDKNE